MTAEDPDRVTRLFADLVEEKMTAAYVQLLNSGGIPKQQAAEFLGGEDTLKALSDLGMAHVSPHTPASPATVRATRPDLALAGVLTGLQARLLQGTQQLLDGHHRLSRAQATYHEPPPMPEHLIRLVTDRDEIIDLTKSLINTAHRDWMTLETLTTDMPLTPDFTITASPATRESVRLRSVYDEAYALHPLGARLINASIKAGEQARILPKIPMKMQLADSVAVLLPLTPAGTGGALLIRAAPIANAMRNYFDLLWEKAIPYGSPQETQSTDLLPRDKEILQLLALGFPDETIARKTGTSVSTVRRRVDAIAKHLGTHSRFALGAAAQRRGWLA